MNNSKDIILEYFHQQGQSYTLLQWSTTVSSYGIGGLLGAVLGPKVLGRSFGRRATLLVNNFFLWCSSAFLIFAPTWWYQAVGRVLVGLVAGVATAVVPTYFSEISPLQLRGAIGTMHQLGITVGILLSQALSTPSLHLLGSLERWQWLFVVPLLCSVLELLVLPFCPESPSYLYQTEGEDAALESLTRLLSSKRVAYQYLEYIRDEVGGHRQREDVNDNDRKDTHKDDKQIKNNNSQNMTITDLLQDQPLRKQIIVGIMVQLMMQFSGIDAVFYYSTTVFQQANVADPELATTFLGAINVIVTIIAVALMDSAGRKTLLTYSWIGMCFSFGLLTISFVGKSVLAGQNMMNQLAVVAMTGVIVFFAFGPGCIAWFIIAEIFPLYARDSAMALGIFINWIANWLVAFSFPLLLEFTQPFTFLIFVATTAFFLWFTQKFVPETKGKTIAEVKKSFDLLSFSMNADAK